MGSLNWLELIYYLKVSAAAKVLSAVSSRTMDTCHAWIPALLTLGLKGWELFDFITVIKSTYFKGLGAFISGCCSQNWSYGLSRLDKTEFFCLKEKGNMNFGRRMTIDKSFSFLPSKGRRLSFFLEEEFIRAIPTIVCRAERFKTCCTPTSFAQKMLLCSVY